jgi:quercetin dioxygenase-like cupin family protein
MKTSLRWHASLVLLVGAAIGAGATAVLAAESDKPQLTLFRVGSRPLIDGPAENFTGKARIDRQVRPDGSNRPMGSMVYFEPGARTAWHTHPLGQTLIVTSGCGWVQTEGGSKKLIQPGDVIWTPPNTRHWHGAQPGVAMAHYAIVEPLNGVSATWMEKVTDEQYAPQEQGKCMTWTTN